MDKNELKALIAEVIAEAKPATAPTRTYVRTDVRTQALLQELLECDVAYKEALQKRKEAEEVTQASRARMEELLVESRKLKIPQIQLAEALSISRGAVSSRIITARKSVRKRKTTK